MTKEEKIINIINKKFNSQAKFCREIEMPQSTLSSILKRGVNKSSVDSIIKICKGLGISVEELTETADKPKIELSSKEEKLIEMYRKLPEERQLAYIGRLELEVELTTKEEDKKGA